jgi:hypothetical protein
MVKLSGKYPFRRCFFREKAGTDRGAKRRMPESWMKKRGMVERFDDFSPEYGPSGTFVVR